MDDTILLYLVDFIFVIYLVFAVNLKDILALNKKPIVVIGVLLATALLVYNIYVMYIYFFGKEYMTSDYSGSYHWAENYCDESDMRIISLTERAKAVRSLSINYNACFWTRTTDASNYSKVKVFNPRRSELGTRTKAASGNSCYVICTN